MARTHRLYGLGRAEISWLGSRFRWGPELRLGAGHCGFNGPETIHITIETAYG